MTIEVHNLRKQLSLVGILTTLMMAATACGEGEPRQADLPKRPDQWVSSVTLDVDSEVRFIGKTRDLLITSVSTTRQVDSAPTIRVGDDLEGIKIGAIKCSFHWRDATWGGAQYMWRGRWACMAGRNREEVTNAVDDEGNRHFPYIHVAPVSLADE